MRVRIDWFVVITAVFLAVGCGGGGCGGCAGMEPIPGGFPSAQRHPNAAQIRVTPTALAKITADPAGIIGPLAGGGAMNGVIEFPVASCPDICCANNQIIPNCGPIEINLNKLAGDADRLALTPAAINANEGQLNVTVRARIKTKNDLHINVAGSACTIDLDTTRDNTPPDIRIDTQVQLLQDTTTGTTKIVATNTQVSQLDTGDYSLGGDVLCYLGNILPASLIQDQLEGPIQDAINGATCKSCMSVADCSSPFATACTGGECKLANGSCLQEIGLNGRLRGSGIFASLSPGTTGALDIYEVAGGYSIAVNSGLSLGMLGGMLPGGSARDKCGPPATAPAPATIPRSTTFQGNAFNSQSFDVAFGLHKSQLADLAYAGYDGGLFCLTIGSSFVEQLSTDTIGLLSRSLGKLVETNSPMAIGLRPQSPPTIVLGKNTFKDDGSGNMVVDEPLLDISFKALELDFFASIDEQYNRVFTVVTDVHLPIGLQTTTGGELTPVIGSPDDAFTNVSVKNSEAITESPAEIAGLFPTLLGLVLPQLSGGLSPISLPELGGLALSVKAVTAVDNDEFLAIFADLVPAPMARTVDTTAEIAAIEEPPLAVAQDVAQWRGATPARVTLALGGSERDLEFSYRIDGGSWSGWSKATRQVVSSRVFWLPGVHKVEVRSRQIGAPETLDPEPVLLELPLGTGEPLHTGGKAVARTVGFHGQAGASGCSCDSGGSANGALFALVIAMILVPWRRVKRAVRLGPVMWSAVIALLPGCSCGSDPCGSAECLPGDVAHTTGGRWTSIASDDKRVLVATYEQQLGDLVVVDATDPAKLSYKVVDGIPDGATPTYSPDGYRGGVAEEGPDVGAFTSIAISNGTARVAYQDREEASLKYAYETKSGGNWKSYVVDTGDAESGVYASLVIDADKKPAIAYIALGIDDGMGHRNTELRLARATKPDPSSAGDWQSALIASAPGSCAGLCGGDTCVESATAGEPSICVSPSSDCATTCDAMTEVCSAGMCMTKLDEPKVLTPPGGTGLYVSLVVLPDGRLAAAYYDSVRRALVLSVENGRGTSTFTETVLDGDVDGADRGMWSTAVVGDDGTVHVAYQDALGDQLMYTSWNGSPGTPAVVDDGQRPGDRPHPVGAGASIFMNGGAAAIAYQDGLVSDVYVAVNNGGTWSSSPIAQGPLLDGFSIAATRGTGGSPTIAWGSLDPAASPPQGLVVKKQ